MKKKEFKGDVAVVGGGPTGSAGFDAVNPRFLFVSRFGRSFGDE